MTGKQRILAAFRGEPPDRVPFCPNLYYWFYSRKAKRRLPREVADLQHPFDLLRRLGADILARWDTQAATREVYSAGEYDERFEGAGSHDEPVVTAFSTYPPGKSIRRRTFRSPHGTLTHTWQWSAEAGADFEAEYWWKDWSEYAAVRYLLESRDYIFDEDLFRQWRRRAGEDGVVMVHLTQSPLKTFHWLAGPPNASLFLADHPREMQVLARIHAEKALALLRRAVEVPETEVFITLDNLDSDFHPPYFFKDYCADFYRSAAEIVHSRNKIFAVHSCGRNRALLPLVGACRVDCLEGLTPPPLGNVELGQARQLTGYESFTVNGGMDTPRLESRENASAVIDRYTRDLFASMGDKLRFIFASSCSTPAPAPWENLVRFRDAALKYGQLS